jgi:hypothetical protein
LAKLYRETYEDIKNDKEADEILANRVYEKYQYMFDSEGKPFTKPSDQYDLANKRTEEEIIFSTDMSDPESDLIYKRYKSR